jgi:hypothetical protein
MTIEIEARKIEFCKENCVEIYDKNTGMLVGRVKETEIQKD